MAGFRGRRRLCGACRGRIQDQLGISTGSVRARADAATAGARNAARAQDARDIAAAEAGWPARDAAPGAAATRAGG